MEVAQDNPETWAVGFLDECWWSRLALPTLSSFSEQGKPLRLVQQSVAKDDPDPKAISCYGLYLPHLDQTWLRFVDGRPVSSITRQFLRWCAEKLEGIGKKVLLLIWDNASWHVSKETRRWLGKHNRRGGLHPQRRAQARSSTSPPSPPPYSPKLIDGEVFSEGRSLPLCCGTHTALEHIHSPMTGVSCLRCVAS